MAQEVSILPVFNQAATNVWRDFFNIRKACMSAIYNYNLQKSDCENEIKEYKYNWEKKNFNFAFAAYIHNRMVGFIQGDSSMNTAYIRNLYVRPEYTLKKLIVPRNGSTIVLKTYPEKLSSSLLTFNTSSFVLGLIPLAGFKSAGDGK